MMAVLLLSLIMCLILVSSSLANSHLSPRSSLSNGTVACERDYSCLDCSTVQVCAPTLDGQSLYEIDRFTCDSSCPYCNNTSGTCSTIFDPTCYDLPNTTVSNNFTCMRDGYFPDPYNCSMYYHCQNEIPYRFYCFPPYPFYDPGSEGCVSYNYYCANTTAYNCRYYNSGTKLGLWNSNSVFLYCGVNDTIITVDKCIGAYIFDSNAQLCVPHCPHAGLFPKDDNCSDYYKCSPKTHGWYTDFLRTDLTCPQGQAFSQTDYSCVNRSLVPNCHVPYPALFNK